MATQTINTLPSADSNFVSNVQNFLQQEEAERAQLRTPTANKITSGGIGPTDASLAHTISACVGFPNGSEVIHGGGAGKYLSLDATPTFVMLECFYTGVWTITQEYGTTSFEA